MHSDEDIVQEQIKTATNLSPRMSSLMLRCINAEEDKEQDDLTIVDVIECLWLETNKWKEREEGTWSCPVLALWEENAQVEE